MYEALLLVAQGFGLVTPHQHHSQAPGLQYGKAEGRAWYLFSHKHKVRKKEKKIAEQAVFRSFATDYSLLVQAQPRASKSV